MSLSPTSASSVAPRQKVIPVIRADGRVIGTGKPGPISLRMIARFREITREGGTPIYFLRDSHDHSAREMLSR
jgi:hypothetical protein